MTTDSDKEKEVKEVHDKYDNILQFINETVPNEILPALKDKIWHTKLKLIVYILMLFVYIRPMLECYGWMGIIIVIITFFILNYLPNNYRNAKRDVSDDFEDKNAQINKTRISTKPDIPQVAIHFSQFLLIAVLNIQKILFLYCGGTAYPISIWAASQLTFNASFLKNMTFNISWLQQFLSIISSSDLRRYPGEQICV